VKIKVKVCVAASENKLDAAVDPRVGCYSETLWQHHGGARASKQTGDES